MTDLNEILVFIRVVQLGSFSKAAKALDMPVSTVSHKVSELEKRLGVTLLQRTTRKLNLTRHGAPFYEQSALHLQGLEEAQGSLTQVQVQAEGLLRVTIPVTMSRALFMDFVSRFLKQYPAIRLDLVVTNRYVDLVADNIDLAIRFGRMKDSSVVAKHLGFSRRILVASSEYLKKHGTPKQPRDLETHRAVLFHGERDEFEWELINGKRRVKVSMSGVASGSDLSTVYELALRGNGIAFLLESYYSESAKQAGLQQILPAWSSDRWPVHAVYSSRKFLPARLQLFLQQLIEWQNPNWR